MKNKDFDCVEMKHEIQQRILKETEGMTLDERRRHFEQRITANPRLGPLWERMMNKRTAAEPGRSES